MVSFLFTYEIAESQSLQNVRFLIPWTYCIEAGSDCAIGLFYFKLDLSAETTSFMFILFHLFTFLIALLKNGNQEFPNQTEFH
jgi:hypothetical protein